MGQPIIGVCSPWSELNPGLWHFRALGDAVKRGIWAVSEFPLAVVEDGDTLELDARAGKVNLLVEEREIQLRLAAWEPPPPAYELGYRSLWLDQVAQAPEGCEFRFNVDPAWRKKG
jgi:dihydroxyacid dehydratase/phosphogluconate dehydratase